MQYWIQSVLMGGMKGLMIAHLCVDGKELNDASPLEIKSHIIIRTHAAA